MLKGFKDFIMRGNVVDLAVGVTIGAAFTAVVTSFSDSFLKPLINLIGGEKIVGSFTLVKEGNAVTWGAFLSTLIGFALTAAVIYFLVVLPMNKLAERRRRGEEPPPKSPSEEVKLLMEIRDALLAGQGGGDGRVAPSPRSEQAAEEPEQSR